VSRLLDALGEGATYAAAGVSIEGGDAAVARIAPLAAATSREGVVAGVGGFAGLFATPPGYRDPLIVASADGVGTKLEVARRMGRVDTVGVDLVAMLVDDLVCCGAEPLFVLDYLAVGRLDAARVEAVVAGVAEGCRLAGAALLGGETAEHPGVMEPDAIDLAGFAVGAVERDRVLGPERVRDGDSLLGLPSPGLRANGYSLARRVFSARPLDGPAWPGSESSLGEELLRPSVIYAPAVRAMLADLGLGVHAAAHVTGGGIVGNVARILPAGLGATIDLGAFTTPEIFYEIQRAGRVGADEMVRVFNCGLGMVVALDPEVADAAISLARAAGHAASVVGEVRAGATGVTLS
jgi:phosphoribosylformylglycinamidine cyclo-ligase